MPVTISLRFYEELNDYLPREKRKRTFTQVLEMNDTVGGAIEAGGVPLSQVDLVLVNGEAVDFSFRLGDGDRISVYPVFESFDITPLTRLKGRPLRSIRFLVDSELTQLEGRLLERGFDVKRLPAGVEMEKLVEMSRRERRIVLTRQRNVAGTPGLARVYRLRSSRPEKQLAEVMARLDLG